MKAEIGPTGKRGCFCGKAAVTRIAAGNNGWLNSTGWNKVQLGRDLRSSLGVRLGGEDRVRCLQARKLKAGNRKQKQQ